MNLPWIINFQKFGRHCIALNTACVLSHFSRVQLFATPWTIVLQAPPSMKFSKQEYWSGLSCPSPGNLPEQGIKPKSPALHVDSLQSEPPRKSQIVGQFQHQKALVS